MFGEPLERINAVICELVCAWLLLVSFLERFPAHFIDLFLAIASGEVVSGFAKRRLGQIHFLLLFNFQLQLFLLFHAQSLQLEPICVKELEPFLQLWQLFIPQHKLAFLPEPDFILRLHNRRIAFIHKLFAVIEAQNCHDKNFEVVRRDLLRLQLCDVSPLLLFIQRIIPVAGHQITVDLGRNDFP